MCQHFGKCRAYMYFWHLILLWTTIIRKTLTHSISILINYLASLATIPQTNEKKTIYAEDRRKILQHNSFQKVRVWARLKAPSMVRRVQAQLWKEFENLVSNGHVQYWSEMEHITKRQKAIFWELANLTLTRELVQMLHVMYQGFVKLIFFFSLLLIFTRNSKPFIISSLHSKL